jgi:anhydro-N-acetylmuramic acid kinase
MDAFYLNADQISQLDVTYGEYLGELLKQFIHDFQLKPQLIASHGHTIFHQPELSLTSQIGSGAHIAAISEIQTICDFRTVDVALGGQGAPLVPIGDLHLFSEFDYCLNLGGISNISYQESSDRISFDISLANIVGNYLCKSIDLSYDENGKIAKSGNIDTTLLQKMNNFSFFNQKPPKSLGKEFFVKQFKPILDASNIKTEDKLHTFGVHLGQQVGKIIKNGSCLISGGGAYNDFWIEEIKKNTNGNIVIPSKEIIDYKEALIFAFLGALRLEQEINCLASVTGANRNNIGGCIYLG